MGEEYSKAASPEFMLLCKSPLSERGRVGVLGGNDLVVKVLPGSRDHGYQKCNLGSLEH